jgi:hypothetical protein
VGYKVQTPDEKHRDANERFLTQLLRSEQEMQLPMTWFRTDYNGRFVWDCRVALHDFSGRSTALPGVFWLIVPQDRLWIPVKPQNRLPICRSCARDDFVWL